MQGQKIAFICIICVVIVALHARGGPCAEACGILIHDAQPSSQATHLLFLLLLLLRTIIPCIPCEPLQERKTHMTGRHAKQWTGDILDTALP